MPHVEKLQEGEVKPLPPQPQRPMAIRVGDRYVVPVAKEEDFVPTMKLIEDHLNANPKIRGEMLRDSQVRLMERSSMDPSQFSPDKRLAFLAQQIDFPVRRGGLDDVMVRFQVARSDLATEKLVTLKENYPDSEIRFASDIDGNTVILMRRPGEATGIEVESPDFSQGDLGALASGIFSEDVILEILTFLATGGKGGLAKNMMKGFAAGFVGEGIKSGIETLRGREFSSTGAIVERMSFTGAAGAAGVFLFDPTARVRNKIRGVRGIVSVSDEAKRGMTAATDLGQTPRLPGSVHPKFRSIQKQAYLTSNRMVKEVDDQLAEASNDLADFSKKLGDIESLPDDELRRVLARQETKIKGALDSIPNMTWEDAGGKVKEGLDKFFELLSEAEGRDYVKALEKTKNGIYDILPVKKLVGLMEFGIRGPRTIKGKGWTLHTSINVKPIKSADLKSSMKRINQLDDNIKLVKRPDGEENPLDIMIALRSDVFSIMEDQALVGNDRRAAAIIHQSLTDAMFHPTGVDAAGVALWRRAANRTKFKEGMLSKTYVRFITKSDTPEAVARYLTNSGNYTATKDVRRMLIGGGQKDKWIKVQEAFKTSLWEEPSSIRGVLTNKATAATKSLDLLMPKVERDIYLKMGDDIAKMQSSNIAKMLKAGTDDALRLTGLASNGSRREILEFLEAVGGKESARGRALAAGVVKNLRDEATSAGTLKPTFNKQKFADGLHKLRDRGILDDIFTKDSLDILAKHEEAAAFLPEAAGVGEGIQQATAGADVASLLVGQPGKALSGGRTYLKNDLYAWLSTSAGGRRFLTGSYKTRRAPKDLKHAQAIGSALGVILENMLEVSSTYEGLENLGIGSLER